MFSLIPILQCGIFLIVYLTQCSKNVFFSYSASGGSVILISLGLAPNPYFWIDVRRFNNTLLYGNGAVVPPAQAAVLTAPAPGPGVVGTGPDASIRFFIHTNDLLYGNITATTTQESLILCENDYITPGVQASGCDCYWHDIGGRCYQWVNIPNTAFGSLSPTVCPDGGWLMADFIQLTTYSSALLMFYPYGKLPFINQSLNKLNINVHLWRWDCIEQGAYRLNCVDCGAGWIQTNSTAGFRCYKIMSTTPRTWYDAENDCMSNGWHLAVPTSMSEWNTFVTQ